MRIRAAIHRVAFFTLLTCGLQAVYAGTFDPPNLEGINLHFERDADGDGYTNVEEYLNGTDPRKKMDYTNLDNNVDTIS